MRIFFRGIIAAALFLAGCERSTDKQLFETLSAEETGLDFENRILDKKELNIFNYRNFYNGGGVAIGDVNGDGLADIYLTSNFESNKLFLNRGDWNFEDVTQEAGVGGNKGWSTGATFADVNGDGLLDMYVCNAGNIQGDSRGNELFINLGNNEKGIPTFKESAVQYGLVDGGFSTHAAFFDFDRDGDLDMYLLNNSFTPVDKLAYQNFRNMRDNLGGDKLFRNDGDHFTDVSSEAGIYGSLIGFGLGITIGDVNNDNWLDIYISNDFYERDYLYINQKDGTFRESLVDYMPHISLSSMGADIADINNDGNLDIFVTDMLPEGDVRLKTTSVFEGYEVTELKKNRDYWHQYMRNMLHLNNGDGTFTEAGQMAGVHATDWSWGALIFDMDSDGQKDLFVANGIVKNLTDQDYVAFLADKNNIQAMIEGRMKFDYREFVDMISSTPIPNYAYRNKGNLEFENSAKTWGLGKPGFSNGSAYGDLDNDGDLDLIVNNNNDKLGVYRNHSVERFKKHFLRVKLKGDKANPNAIGAKVYIHQKGSIQYLQQMPNRGFQSSSDLTLVFGLNANPVIDSLLVIWPDDRQQLIKNPAADGTLTLDIRQATGVWKAAVPSVEPLPVQDITAKAALNFTHQENEFVDYYRDGLLKQKYSTQGPALAVGDVNGDGLDDVYLGAAAGKISQLFIQTTAGTFQSPQQESFAQAAAVEETAAVFFDADGDGDLDLYVVTGGNEFLDENPVLVDRLYFNDGRGNFTYQENALPRLFDNGSCVTAADFDGDGDLDLFVGTRLISGQYGMDPPSRLLINGGKGTFTDQSQGKIAQWKDLGMVTDARWEDLDKDSFPDLVIVGDWMPVTIYKNEKGKKLTRYDIPTLIKSNGWWNSITATDIDGDGDMDFVLGNLGKNTKMLASESRPAQLYTNDFDRNGSVEQVITCYAADGRSYPMVMKSDIQKVLPVIKKKFVKHTEYAGKTIDELFTPEQMQGVVKKVVYTSTTSLLINNGNFSFTLTALPQQAQLSPIFGSSAFDYNQDGKPDLFLTGNFFDVLPEIGRYDSNYGQVLLAKGGNQFSHVPPAQTGFRVRGQVRRMALVRGNNGRQMLVLAKNNDAAQLFLLPAKTSR
ncbi:FG-GAP-like repeat-containing protein [Arundinibacter roseus]|uniref:RNA-binding protein n=1 Tax=Arundinibacter roseus TaxID=2070510 RepID=A0A4R4K0K0_9BACT|nr:FG-GAP-like repeat-containing protein [Arundinibacter roseus]TDB59851.1 RNA-binding protein [Arundinibacter roseus]